MKRLLSKRVVGVCLLLVFALYLLRPDAGWMRAKVTGSIAQALGRKIEIGSVRLRFLPRPGFELDDVVVSDDPAFGAEPLLRAPEVEAAVRLTAALRGRLEISRLSLSDASLNITRNLNGRWNLQDLLERTAHSSMAPTGAGRQSAAPSFPYIEANSARVNLKLGTEKTHFALTNADLSLWQDSADTWAARLQARPIRTDSNLTDTGVINVAALWRRSATLKQAPLQISFQWKQAQIGQLSKLVYGADKGWRGDVLLSGSVLGTPEHLKFVTDATVDNFRRQDLMGDGDLRLAAHCVAEYSVPTRTLWDLDCASPSGGGYLELKGGASGLLAGGEPFSTSDLWLDISHVPVSSATAAAHHFTSLVPADLEGNGAVSATIELKRQHEGPITIDGTGSVESLQLARAGSQEQASFGTVPLSITNILKPLPVVSQRHKNNARQLVSKEAPQPIPLQVEIGPVDLGRTKTGILVAHTTIGRDGYSAGAQGEAAIQRLLQVARVLGLPAPAVNADGEATVHLSVSAEWGQKPAVTGTAHLRSVRAQVRGLNAPLTVLGADLVVSPDSVLIQNLSATAANTTWHGSMTIPRPCPAPSDCEVQFKLRTTELSGGALNTLLNPSARPRAWYRFLSLGGEQKAYLLRARAAGSIVIEKLTLGRSVIKHFDSELMLDEGTIALQNFRGEFLQGIATGTWEANFAAKPPNYHGSGTFEDVSMAALAELMHDQWVLGSGNTKYQFTAAGSNLPDLLDSAEIGAQFKLRDAGFPHVVLGANSGPLKSDVFSGSMQVVDGTISFHDAKLSTGNEVYTVSGTASLPGALNLRVVTETAGGYVLTGTWLRTRVSAIPNAEASLKP